MNKLCFRLVVAILLTFFSNVARGEANHPCLYAKLSTDNVLTVYYDKNWGYYVYSDWPGGYYTTYDGVIRFLDYSEIMQQNSAFGIDGDLGKAIKWILNDYDSLRGCNVQTIVFDNSLNTLRDVPIKDASHLFSFFESLTAIVGWENLDMSQITNIESMFVDCKSLKNVDLSSFHTENVTDMSTLFDGCISLEKVDMSHFSTSNVKSVYGMFRDCHSLKAIDLSKSVFDLQKAEFFANCTSLETIHMGTLKCVDMYGMFSGLTALKTLDFTGPVSGFEICTNMFENCTSLEVLDLSMLDTSHAGTMEHMFYGCSNIVSIYVGDGWDVSKVWHAVDMFKGCTNIVGQYGTTYNDSKTDISMAHYGAGGYLRYKGTQGINPTTATSPSGEGMYYTLDGRKVANPTKGVYIDKGKKVVIK